MLHLRPGISVNMIIGFFTSCQSLANKTHGILFLTQEHLQDNGRGDSKHAKVIKAMKHHQSRTFTPSWQYANCHAPLLSKCTMCMRRGSENNEMKNKKQDSPISAFMVPFYSSPCWSSIGCSAGAM